MEGVDVPQGRLDIQHGVGGGKGGGPREPTPDRRVGRVDARPSFPTFFSQSPRGAFPDMSTELQGQEMHFKDHLHPAPLPGSFMWGQMVLE